MHKHQLARGEQQQNNPTCKHETMHLRLPMLRGAYVLPAWKDIPISKTVSQQPLQEDPVAALQRLVPQAAPELPRLLREH